MATYVYRNGKLVDKRYVEPLMTKGQASYVISDEMAPTRHMADCNMYTSKAKFRAATRAHGCIEVGNDTSALTKPRQRVELDRGLRREHIQRAIYDLKNK